MGYKSSCQCAYVISAVLFKGCGLHGDVFLRGALQMVDFHPKQITSDRVGQPRPHHGQHVAKTICVKRTELGTSF